MDDVFFSMAARERWIGIVATFVIILALVALGTPGLRGGDTVAIDDGGLGGTTTIATSSEGTSSATSSDSGATVGTGAATGTGATAPTGTTGTGTTTATTPSSGTTTTTTPGTTTTTTTQPSGATAPGTTTQAPPTSDPQPGATAAPANPQPAATTAPPASANRLPSEWKGVTDDEIRIGISYVQDDGGGAAAAGLGTFAVDEREEAEILVDWVNANGGIDGRQVVPVYHASQLGDFSARGAACAAFTEDNEVFGVIASFSPDLECMHERQTPVITAQGISDESLELYGATSFSPGGFAANRKLLALIDGLVRTNFFEPVDGQPVVIGALVHEIAREGLQPVLDEIMARYGLAIDEYGEAGDACSRDQGVVLQFAQAGVTHIITPAGYSPVCTMQAANSQLYYPRWSLDSSQNPAALENGLAPEDQLENTTIVGTNPATDIGAGTPMSTLGPNNERCRQIRADAGLAVQNDVRGGVSAFCETWFGFLKMVAQASALTPAGIGAAFEAGGDWDSTSAYAATWGTGLLHAGGVGFRTLAWDTGCSCFQYSSDVLRAPA